MPIGLNREHDVGQVQAAGGGLLGVSVTHPGGNTYVIESATFTAKRIG